MTGISGRVGRELTLELLEDAVDGARAAAAAHGHVELVGVRLRHGVGCDVLDVGVGVNGGVSTVGIGILWSSGGRERSVGGGIWRRNSRRWAVGVRLSCPLINLYVR